jgi:hypothetical protein
MITDSYSKLLPCPFCGGPVTMLVFIGYSIACNNADCFHPVTLAYGNREDCVAAWNRRAPPSEAFSASARARDSASRRLAEQRDTAEASLQAEKDLSQSLRKELDSYYKLWQTDIKDAESLLRPFIDSAAIFGITPDHRWSSAAEPYRVAFQIEIVFTKLRKVVEALRPFASYQVISIGMDLDGFVIKLVDGGQQPTFADFARARAALSSIGEV